MSSRIEEPPDGLEAVDEDTLLKRYDEWSKNLANLARVMCDHADGVDERGHQRRPCERCVKVVRHVTEFWFMAMHTKARALLARSEKDDIELPLVDLHEAYFIASCLLDPVTSVQLGEWGAA